jgi:predicted peptidase
MNIGLYRILFIISLSFLITSCKKEAEDIEVTETRPPVLKANSVDVNKAIGGFYSAVPEHYNENTNTYPLIIFLHGSGQVGNGTTALPSVAFGGIPKLLKDGLFPPGFKVNGKYFSFIILAPQFKWWDPDVQDVISFIDYARKNFRVDSTRIYLSGLSGGGVLTTEVAAEYSSKLAAIVPIAGVSSGGDVNLTCEKIAEGNLPVWVFHNDADSIINVAHARNFITTLKSFRPAILPKYTEFLPFGLEAHDAWTKATDPAYKENNMNIYEWMLQYSR